MAAPQIAIWIAVAWATAPTGHSVNIRSNNGFSIVGHLDAPAFPDDVSCLKWVSDTHNIDLTKIDPSQRAGIGCTQILITPRQNSPTSPTRESAAP